MTMPTLGPSPAGPPSPPGWGGAPGSDWARAVSSGSEPIRAKQQLDRMHRRNARPVGDLKPARLAVTGGEVRLSPPHLPEEPGPHVHRDIVLLLLQPIGSGDAAALHVQVDHPELGDEREKVQGGLPDAVAPLLAWSVVGHSHRQRIEVRSQPAQLAQSGQELTDVVRMLTD